MLVLIAIAGCLGPPGAGRGGTEVAYLPGLNADVRLPSVETVRGTASRGTTTAGATASGRRTPVVVLVPGGGWRTADYAGLLPLADALTAAGMVAVSISYQGSDDGGRFPQMVSQVVCGIDFAADRARRAGLTPGPVVVLGHSAGAHLAALAALATDHFRSGCPYPAVTVDALVGLAGVYDVELLRDVAQALFGVDEAAAPQRWREGTPATWAAARLTGRPVRILIAHGTADALVSPLVSSTLAHQLTVAGQPATLELVPGATHNTMYQPAVIATRVITWISG